MTSLAKRLSQAFYWLQTEVKRDDEMTAKEMLAAIESMTTIEAKDTQN
jgi:hypothetical protein